ncbi:hypothetical protein GCM10010376_92240 [Streptomyces violaceusniger]
MVRLRVPGPPQLLEVAGHGPGRVDDHVTAAEDPGLGGQLAGVAVRGEALPLDPPGAGDEFVYPVAVAVAGPPVGQGVREGIEAQPGVGHQRLGPVLHRERGPVCQGGEGGRAARLLAQAGAGHPEDTGLAHRRQIQLTRMKIQVGRARQPVEVQREVVRREDLAEGDRCRRQHFERHHAVVPSLRGPGISGENGSTSALY